MGIGESNHGSAAGRCGARGSSDQQHRSTRRSPGECAAASSPDMLDLAERISAAAGTIHAAEAELIDLLGAFDSGDGWRGAGIRSLEHWLTLKAGFTLAEARARARLVDRNEGLRVLFGSLSEGRFSVGALRNAVEVATPTNEADINLIATTCTATQAKRVFNEYAKAEEAESSGRGSSVHPPANAGDDDVTEGPSNGAGSSRDDSNNAAEWFSTFWDDQGYLNINARLNPDIGALVRPALDAMRANRYADARARHLSNAEALERLLRLGLDSANRSGARTRNGERFSAHVTISAETLAGLWEGNGVLDDGHVVDAGIVRRWLASDACTIQPVITSRGRPLHVGREIRTANRWQRRALLLRDRGCAFPGCEERHWVDAHHVQHWEDGGETNLDNLVLLCTAHHRLHHQGEYSITMVEGAPRFEARVERAGSPAAAYGPDPTNPAPCRARVGSSAGIAETRKKAKIGHDSTVAKRSGERLTSYAIGVYVEHLLLPHKRAVPAL